MNVSTQFQSPLADQIERFLSHHRALGKRYDSEESALRLLDRFVFEQGDIVTIEQIRPALLERFLLSRPRTSNRSYNHLQGVLQRLFRWLVVQQVLVESPLRVHPRGLRQQRLPFLFERTEVARLLEIAARLPDAPHAHQRGTTYRMIFALMYGLGLRVSEVARLCYRDLNRQTHCLHIRQTKFAKSRLVPFGPRMTQAIERYLGGRLIDVPAPDNPLFSLARDHRQPIGSKSISRTFHSLLGQLELEIPPGVSPPRLHCLRHSFAVSTLVRWYRSGIDPAQHLMHLSTFLGHVNPSSTAVYLTITTELLELASDRFQSYAAPVLPEMER